MKFYHSLSFFAIIGAVKAAAGAPVSRGDDTSQSLRGGRRMEETILKVYDFEGTDDLTNDWIGRDGGGYHSGKIVQDPLDPSNHAVTFGRTYFMGDLFTKQRFPGGSAVTFRVYSPSTFQEAERTGACLGYAEGLPGSHDWSFCDASGYTGSVHKRNVW